MTAAGPRHKGVGLLGVVEALKANPHTHRFVPEPLKHYLQDPILPSGWYPERDYNGLIQALAIGLDRVVPGGDVWRYFGRAAAQRDIAGDQAEVPARSHVKTAGVYRNFRDNSDPHDLAGLFQRVARLWRMYHDSGQFSVLRAADDPCSVLMRLVDFSFPVRGLAELQTSYMVEYARLLGFELQAALVRCATEGDLFYEWRLSVEHNAQHCAALAVLPCARESR